MTIAILAKKKKRRKKRLTLMAMTTGVGRMTILRPAF
jgi:hypothetical protein